MSPNADASGVSVDTDAGTIGVSDDTDTIGVSDDTDTIGVSHDTDTIGVSDDTGAASRSSPRKVMQAALFATAAAIPLLVWGLRPVELGEQLILATTSLVLFCLSALQLVTGLPANAHGIARWRTGPWFLLWAALAFGGASLTWLGPQVGSARRIMLSSVVDALLIVGVSLAVWTVGYLAGPPKPLRETCHRAVAWMLRGTRPEIRGGAVPWLLYGVGTGARLATLLLSGGFGYVGDPSRQVTQAASYGHVLTILASATTFAIAAAAYRAFATRDVTARVTVVVLVAVEITIGAVAGGKESFVIAVLAVLIPYGAVNGRISLGILTVASVTFLAVAVPFNLAYRPVVRGDHGNLDPAAAVDVAPTVLSTVVQQDSPTGHLMASAVTMAYRLREIDSIAIVSQRTPTTVAYRNPVNFAVAPVIALIPRAVWPGKPILATGYRFSQDYYGLPSNVYTSSAITPMGDLYRHGGWLTVAVGMVLLGIGFRLFDTLFRVERDPRAIFFVLVFLPTLVKAEVDMYSLIISFPTSVLTAVLGAHAACRGRAALGGLPR